MARSKDGPLEMRSESAKRAMKSVNQKLHQSTHQKNIVSWHGYNEYMVHHYAYMAKLVEVCEPKSSAIMKMRQLVRIMTWNLQGSGPQGFRAQRLMHFKLKDEKFPTNKGKIV